MEVVKERVTRRLEGGIVATRTSEQVQGIVNSINRAQLDLGMVETRKHGLLHNIMNIQDQLALMQGEFEKEYGTFDINIQDGTINYKEDVEADKKD